MKPPHMSSSSSPPFNVFATRKWSVMDAPGVLQPEWSSMSLSIHHTQCEEEEKEAFSVTDGDGNTHHQSQNPNPNPSPNQHGSKSLPQPSLSQQGRRIKAGSGPKIIMSHDASQSSVGGQSFVAREAHPQWLNTRLSVYEAIAAKRHAELAQKQRVSIAVHNVTLLLSSPPEYSDDHNTNGQQQRSTLSFVSLTTDQHGAPFQAWKTTPLDVAISIGKNDKNVDVDAIAVARVTYRDFVPDYSLYEDGMEGVDTVMSLLEESESVNVDPNQEEEEEGKDNGLSLRTYLWDVSRPLVGNVQHLEFLTFTESADAKMVFWHSSAHILGEALEHVIGSKLTIGPPLAGGFYYDSFMGSDTLREDDYAPIESEVSKIVKQKQKFERLVITKEEGLELFADNPFKVQILTTKVPDNSRTTVYKCGNLIDLCRGPHVSHTGKIKALSVTRHSATNWLGNTANDSLQRMYGVSFPDKKMLKVWKENQEKAKERDHRRIATKQELIMFHDLSAGSAFWLPHGTRIYNTLIEFIRNQYWDRGYDEVITPNIFNLDLWHKSGHALHYKDAMFNFNVEGHEWAMKPMNCPAHCLMFGGAIRSYRDLPLRYADFGVLHRNELSGALTGLTRVRRFVQDDAHIYCREDQIADEVLGALQFMKFVYDVFGMTYTLELSTRPAKALGDADLWDRAEAALADAMNRFAGEKSWRINPGDGAFYGPKIDIKVMDAMDRIHQCATIQLDFQLPIRFDLQYTTGVNEEGKQFARPVMVHRAMLGSVERMFAVLCEHYGGKWPLWLSPRQIMLIPVHAQWNEYCEEVRQKMHRARFYVDVDVSKNTFQKKVRNAQVAQYNFQLVVGEKEVQNGTVNIRNRENAVEGEMKVDEFIDHIKNLRATYK